MRGNRISSEVMRPGRGRRWRAVLSTAATIALAAGMSAPAAAARDVGAQAPAAAPAVSPRAHTVSIDGYSFLVDGKRTYLWSGEFHYFRLPSPDLWRDIFQKMKAAGFNSTSLYFDWGYHSPKPGVYDFSGVRDVDKLLDMAEEAGLYVIARPAPYINAEVDSGGLPGWLTTKAGNNRSDDPRFLKYADEWLTQIDRIIARHQLTNGTGSVIAYQVENEYYNGSAAGHSYMKHLEDKARADGITVPLTGNNNGTFNSGIGALDVDGPDSYPQGFDCSNPSKWNGVPDISYDHPAGRPLYSPEFQGGAFDPWGGPGYDKCAQLINDQFANVFYKQNIAVGATAQSFYMTYGGTNWGWLGMPQNYTSYDYGAAIRENRQLDPKYDEDKLIGYFTQSVAPLTKTETIRATPPDDSAVVDTARMNPDTRTQFHVLRHGNSTSTAVDKTHIAVDFNAQPSADTTYTWDDPDSALQYTGSWSHVADQSYTGGDYKHTESFSNKAGDSVTVPFDGTAIRWIGSKTNNHGNADVYLDGTKVATVDDSGSENQAVVFQKTGLPDGAHTLKIVVDGSHSSGSTDDYVAIDAIDVPTGTAAAEPTYPVVPQQPGTAITLDGRDSHVIVATDFGVLGSVRSVESEARPGEEPAEDAVPVLQRLEPPAEQGLQFAEGAGGQVGQAPLDVRPQALDRVELGRIPGQQDHRQPFPLGHECLHRLGGVGVQPVPHHDQRGLEQVVGAIQEVDVVALAERAALALAAGVPAQPVTQAGGQAGPVAQQPGHREPSPAATGHFDLRGDAASAPGAALGRPTGHARFVLEADERASRRPEGFTSCQVASRHAVIASSSRSAAGRAGICTLKPIRCSSRVTPETL
ncbi:Beta-galactosidase [Actinobacteria bacterium OK006]|nr:Beta-galactosidase [Actinobacteria bacterium OK006]